MTSSADHFAMFVVMALCASILVLAESLHRTFAVEPEWTRKLVHVLMGLTASAFPWLFHDPRSVVLICALFALILGASRALSQLPSVHRVDRRTAGALWFPLAVAWVFVASGGRPELFVIPMLVLTLADTAAAVVGRAPRAHLLPVGMGKKTVEGSLAFFLVSCECLLVGLALTAALQPVELVVRAVGIAAVLTAVELVSPAGSDNLFVPLAAFILLRASGPAGASLAVAAVVLAAAAALAVGAARRAQRERAHA
jgi:phytol kinase